MVILCKIIMGLCYCCDRSLTMCFQAQVRTLLLLPLRYQEWMSVGIKQNREIAAKVWKFQIAQTWAGGNPSWVIHHYVVHLSNTIIFRQKLTRRKFIVRQGRIDIHLLSTYSKTFPGFILWFALWLKIIKTERQTWKISSWFSTEVTTLIEKIFYPTTFTTNETKFRNKTKE